MSRAANGPRSPAGRRLGLKKAAGEYVKIGNIIFRQKGTLWYPGENVKMGRDHTIMAMQPGYAF
jgi:ribosomal protein L27